MYLLDKNIIDEIGEGNDEVSRKVSQIDPSAIFICSVVVWEAINGLNQKILIEDARLRKGQPNTLILAYRSLVEVLPRIAAFPIKHFDNDAEAVYKTLPNAYRQKRLSRDGRIAAVALVNGLILVTRNTKNFQNIEGLEIHRW